MSKRSTARKINFTKASLSRLRPPDDDRYWTYDSKTPSLALMVTKTGAKAFYLYRRVNGRPQRIRLGGFPELTVEQARKEAAKINGDIARGTDPQERKRRLRRQATLGDVFDHYVKSHLELHSTANSLREDVRRFEKHLASWRTRRLDSIRTEEVAALHARLGRKARVEANRVLGLLQRTINHARRQLGITKPNPCDPIRKFKERSRDRFLDAAELRRLFEALAEEPNQHLRDYLLVALLTGARKSNVANMRWTDTDLDRGVWRIPNDESKNKEPMIVILPDGAVDLLRQRDVRHPEYVFRDRSGKLPGLQRGWRRIRERAGISDLHLHDLRRTLGSWQAAFGASLPIIGKSLGHKTPQATAVYARLNLDPVRESVQTATKAMLEAGGVELINGRHDSGD